MDHKTRIVPFDRKYLPFIDDLWKDPQVTCMTGIPARGIDINLWYERYLEGKARSREASEQFIILDEGGEPIGESAFGTLPATFMFGNWTKDEHRPAAMVDIKIVSAKWGRGYGLDAFCQVVDHICEHTGALDIVTLPQDGNERAIRLYTRCGFVATGDVSAHKINVYLLSRESWGQ